MPTDAEFRSSDEGNTFYPHEGAKVHEEVIHAYARAAVVAAELARNLERRREEYAANEKRASEDQSQPRCPSRCVRPGSAPTFPPG